MKKLFETKLDNIFDVSTLVCLGRGKRLREHKMDFPREKDGRVGVVYDFWQLIYMEEGSYTCRIDGNPSCRIEKGQLLICEPRKIRFSYESSEAVAAIISMRCNSQKMMRMKNRLFCLSAEEQSILNMIFDKSTGMMRKVDEDSAYCGVQPAENTADYHLQAVKNYIELLLISLYDRLIKEDAEKSRNKTQGAYYEDKFRIVEDFMKENIRNNVTVDDILEYTGLSLSTIKRVFQQQVGCGVIYYFRKMKIDEAKRMLQEDELTVTEISDRLGFSSVHHFSNIFKKYTGVAPSRYIKSNIVKR